MKQRKSTSRARKPAKGAEQSSDDVYDLQDILDYECRNGVDFYFVHWQGYPISEATWEPRKNILHPSEDLLAKMQQLKSSKQAASAVSDVTAKAPAASPPSAPKSQKDSPSVTTARTSVKRKRSDPGNRESSGARSARDSAQTAGKAVDSFVSTTPRASGAEIKKISRIATVKGVRQDSKAGLVVSILVPNEEDGSMTDVPMKIEDAKEKYARELLDFLVGKIQWKGSTRDVDGKKRGTNGMAN